MLYLKPGVAYKPTYPPDMMPYDGGSVTESRLMSEDLLARQAAQMEIEDVEGERHDVIGSAT